MIEEIKIKQDKETEARIQRACDVCLVKSNARLDKRFKELELESKLRITEAKC